MDSDREYPPVQVHLDHLAAHGHAPPRPRTYALRLNLGLVLLVHSSGKRESMRANAMPSFRHLRVVLPIQLCLALPLDGVTHISDAIEPKPVLAALQHRVRGRIRPVRSNPPLGERCVRKRRVKKDDVVMNGPASLKFRPPEEPYALRVHAQVRNEQPYCPGHLVHIGVGRRQPNQVHTPDGTPIIQYVALPARRADP